MTMYRYRRLNDGRWPAVYAVETPADYIGNIEATSGRPGQSRSTNRYVAYPVVRGGRARISALEELVPSTLPHRKYRAVLRIFESRREAADALVEWLRSDGR